MMQIEMSVKLFEYWIDDNQKLMRLVNLPEAVEIFKNNVKIYKNFENQLESVTKFLTAIGKNMTNLVNIKVSHGNILRNGKHCLSVSFSHFKFLS